MSEKNNDIKKDKIHSRITKDISPLEYLKRFVVIRCLFLIITKEKMSSDGIIGAIIISILLGGITFMANKIRNEIAFELDKDDIDKLKISYDIDKIIRMYCIQLGICFVFVILMFTYGIMMSNTTMIWIHNKILRYNDMPIYLTIGGIFVLISDLADNRKKLLNLLDD